LQHAEQEIPMLVRLLCTIACIGLTATTQAAPPATTRSSTRPTTTTAATTQATTGTDDATADRLIAQLKAAWGPVLPPEVSEGKKEGTDEQKMLMQFLFTNLVTMNKTPERIKESETNRRKGEEAFAATVKVLERARANADREPEPLRQELEKAALAQVEVIRRFNRVTASAVTADATEDEIARRTIENLRDLPQAFRDMIRFGLDAKYHAQRYNLLKTVNDLGKRAATQPAGESRNTLEDQRAASQALITALDAKYQAQQRILKSTPLGQLNNAMLE
jgi:hypothetical protein